MLDLKEAPKEDYMAIEWNESYSIGDEEIDEQHKYLFRLVNEFLEASDKSQLTLTVIHLFKYTRKHFSYEEELMRKVGFDEYEAHVRMHEKLVNRLGQLGTDIVNDSLDKAELERFVKDWAFGHIPKADARLAKFLTNFKPGA